MPIQLLKRLDDSIDEYLLGLTPNFELSSSKLTILRPSRMMIFY